MVEKEIELTPIQQHEMAEFHRQADHFLENHSSRTEKIRTVENRVWRAVAASNAGGVAATLGIMGTVIGSSGGGPLPAELFSALLLFLIGAAFSLTGLFVELGLVVNYRPGAMGGQGKIEVMLPRRYTTLLWVHRAVATAALGCLVSGVASGLTFLASLTG